MSESLVKVTKLSSLAHLYFELDTTSFPGFSPTRPTERRVGENPGNEVELDIEQDKMYKPLLMKQETKQLEWF